MAECTWLAAAGGFWTGECVFQPARACGNGMSAGQKKRLQHLCLDSDQQYPVGNLANSACCLTALTINVPTSTPRTLSRLGFHWELEDHNACSEFVIQLQNDPGCYSRLFLLPKHCSTPQNVFFSVTQLAMSCAVRLNCVNFCLCSDSPDQCTSMKRSQAEWRRFLFAMASRSFPLCVLQQAPARCAYACVFCI